MVFDGPLTSISDKFGRAKLLHLEFADSAPQNGLERYGEVTRRDGPVAELSIDRGPGDGDARAPSSTRTRWWT